MNHITSPQLKTRENLRIKKDFHETLPYIQLSNHDCYSSTHTPWVWTQKRGSYVKFKLKLEFKEIE